MATWQVFVNDQATNGVDPNVTLTLDGGMDFSSPPGDFSWSNITAVQFYGSITGSGWGDDSWGTVLLQLRHSGGTIASISWSTSGNQNTTITTGPTTDPSPSTGFTALGMRCSLSYNKVKGADGGSIRMDNASYVVITYTPSGTTYDETGREFTVTSTTTETDLATRDEQRNITLASTVTATNIQDMVEGVTASVASTVTLTDNPTWVETLATSIVSTITGTDFRVVEELGLEFTITSTVTRTDLLTLAEDVVAALATTVTRTDIQAMVEDLATSIAATITRTDVLSGGTTYDETGREFLVLVSITETNIQDMVEQGQVSILATITESDIGSFGEGVNISLVSIVSGFDDLIPAGGPPPGGELSVRGVEERLLYTEEDDDTKAPTRHRRRLRSS